MNLNPGTILHFFNEAVEKYPSNIYLLEKTGAEYEGTTYSRVRELVYRFAAGLISLGLKKGDRVTLLAEGRNAWVISELGILHTGAVNVPLSVKLTEPDEIRYRLAHSGVKMAIVSDRQAEKVRGLKVHLPMLEKIILLDNVADESKGEITFEKVLALGDDYLDKNRNTFGKILESVQPGDLANICYTSGTTADPKGIMLSHRNYVANVEQGYTIMDIPDYFTTLLILPWDHCFAHTAGIFCMMGKGASMAAVELGKSGIETLKNIPQSIREVRPHLLLSAPALAINFKKNIEKSIRDKGPVIYRLFKHALSISYKYNGDGFVKGKGLTALYKPLMKLYDKILFSKVREGFGGRLEFFVGGAALLDIELQRFFYAIGIPMLQGYGLSEASPIISANALVKHKLGSSGILPKNLELKICDDKGLELPVGEKGEIVIKGENVMQGYWKNPEASAQSLKDGWLFTGDLGYMDKDGFLYVLGRFKSLLISDDGEKFSPEGMEETFESHSRYIDQCMLYNNQNPYTLCLIVPNAEALKRYVIHKGLDPLTAEGQSLALNKIERELQQYRTKGNFENMFPQRWLPAAIGVLSEGFTEQNHMLNSTMKMVRGKIVTHYKDRIDFMFTPAGKDMQNEQNRQAMKILLGS